MRVTVAAVGRLKAGAERELFERYRDRFGPTGRQSGFGPLKEIEIQESSRGSARERREEEASVLLGRIGGEALLIALDETGKAVTSAEFAQRLASYRDNGTREIAFAIGGADGHGSAVSEQAAQTLSLGAMTLPHALARVVLAEQLYRAATILAGHPYHRE
jgi:23S rRNA (pseudouridine1915-N3)-methyltransferase